MAVLVACGDESDDRQFANGNETPRPSATSLPIPDASPVPASPVAIASPLAQEDLVAPRGGSDTFSLVSGDSVSLFDVGRSRIVPLLEVDDGAIWHAQRSPVAGETAVLVSGSAGADWRVVLVDDDGQIQAEIPIHGRGATPRAAPDAVAGGAGGIDWSPDGTRLAVAVPTGGIFEIIDRSTVATMVPASRAPRPGDLAWSRGGRAVAFVNTPNDRSGSGIYVAPAGANPLDPVTLLVPDSTGNRTVGEVQWLVSEDDLLAVIYRQPAPNAIGDLFWLSASAPSPELVASGMPISFRASIESFAVSPDDAVLLYAVKHDVASDTSPWTLVIGQRGALSKFDIPVPEGERVDQLRWTPAGPMVVTSRQAEEGEETSTSIYRIDEDLNLEMMGSTDERDESTPVASPVADIDGSPIASPFASPVAVTDATPIASPVASPLASPRAAEEE